jgi:hypothetical protein
MAGQSLVGLVRTQEAFSDQYSLTFRPAVPRDVLQAKHVDRDLLEALFAWFGPQSRCGAVRYVPTYVFLDFSGTAIGTLGPEISIDMTRSHEHVVDRAEAIYATNWAISVLGRCGQADFIHAWLHGGTH